MKSCLFVILFLSGTFVNGFCHEDENEISPLSEFLYPPQEAPFYFLKSIPATIKLLGKAELSFFRNQSIVTQYRYRLEIPDGGSTVIDRNISRWSPWIGFDFIELIVPVLDLEGGYKLSIEYRTSKNTGILRFEKLFYVYRINPESAVESSEIKTDPVKANSGSTPGQPKGLQPIKAKPVIENASINTREKPVITTAKKKPASGSAAKIIVPPIAKIPIGTNNIGILDLNGIDLNEKSLFYNQTSQNRPKKLANTETPVRPEDLPSQPVASLNPGAGINEKDNDGNTALIASILAGETGNALSIMDQGADLNIKNKLDLSPLHIAVFLDNRMIVNHLLLKGAEVDIKGNSGYTPLHIASELNHAILVKELLSRGASKSIKTDQKLSPKTIARIQNNNEVIKILVSKNHDNLTLTESASNPSGTSRNIASLSPKYEFSLPYNNELVRKRQFNNIMRLVSIPVFSLAAAGTFYFRSKANNYYTSYKTAETMEMAKHYYDKTMQLDTYTYISGGLSFTSAFGIVHFANRKKSISNKMRKTLY